MDADNPADGISAPYHPGQTTSIVIDRATVDAVLPSANGVISTYKQYASVLSYALSGSGATATTYWKYQTKIKVDIPDLVGIVYLGNSSLDGSIVALDPEGTEPGRPRWFGLDNQEKVKSDWNEGRRLRGWVANTETIDAVLSIHGAIFGDKVPLPTADPTFAFTIPKDGSLPLDGAAPSIIDHRGDSSYVAAIPDLGARVRSLTLEHPDPNGIGALYRELSIDHPPVIVQASEVRYRALIETATGLKELT
ncbi:VOC family protein [Sinorhizobium fredii]|uniref:VOC family protein n=1 Tax=Rhizobium fredii TaxID=380 RepID=UPI0035160F8B